MTDDFAMTFDLDGNPISIEQWSELSHQVTRHVARTQVEISKSRHLDISTIWTGISLHKPPLIYETVVFDEEGDVVDGPLRYATRQQAQATHDRIVRALLQMAPMFGLSTWRELDE